MKDIVKLNPDLGLLAIRIGLGVGFLAHGLAKFQGMEGTIGFFGKLGMPSFMAYVVAATETLAGAAMILGVFTQIAGLAIIAVMIGAIYLVKAKMGYMGGYELDLGYLTAALGIVFTGPGKYNVRDCKMGKGAASAPQQG